MLSTPSKTTTPSALTSSKKSFRTEAVRVSFVGLNTMPFLPLPYGLLRAACSERPLLQKRLSWLDPLFLAGDLDAYARQVASSDLALASCYIWNGQTTLEILRRAKVLNPHLLVIVGGPHVPDAAFEFLKAHSFIDFAVHGEGETVLPDLLEALLQEESPTIELRPNLSFLKNESLVAGPRTKMTAELRWASPYLQGWMDSSLQLLQEKGLPPIALWETNRGCPYSCSFCDWGSDTMSKMRTFSIERLREELRFFGENKIEELYICDSNFGIFPQDEEIAQWLVETKKQYGYPKGVRLNFAKQSSDRVFRISALFDEHAMHWGTTLSLQSLNEKTLSDIRRKNSSREKMSDLLLQYKNHGIATYTELILGLPEETKESFTRGIDELFQRGQHDDVRVFELSILPNAAMNHSSHRQRSVKKTSRVPLFIERPGQYLGETAEIVTETPWLTFQEWVECQVFSDVVQTCHNGGYTRWLAIFLNRECGVSFSDFYLQLVDPNLFSSSSPWRQLLEVLYDLQRRFGEGQGVPQVHKAMSEPYFREVAQYYHPDRKGWFIYQLAWLKIQDFFDDFYQQLTFVLPKIPENLQPVWQNLIHFQKNTILRPEYDPQRGHEFQIQYNWLEYFQEGKDLQMRSARIRCKDQRTGSNRRYALKSQDKKSYSTAAVGLAYPYSKKHHFMHGLESAVQELLSENPLSHQANLLQNPPLPTLDKN